MRRLILFILLLLLCSQAYSIHYGKKYFYSLALFVEDVTNSSLVSIFSNSLVKEFSRRYFIALNEQTNTTRTIEPDFLFTCNLSREDNKFLIKLKINDLIDKTKRWEDNVYTYDLQDGRGLSECAAALSERIIFKMLGKHIPEYREKIDYQREFGRKGLNMLGKFPHDIKMVNLINIPMRYPYGFTFDFPLAFGLEFFQITYTVLLPNTPLGAGIGTEAGSIHGPMAATILPLQLFIPIFIFPDDYEFNRKDLYLTAEAGFILPQYSYLDISFRFVMNGLWISLGWMYLPYYTFAGFTRPEYNTFYGGITLYFGSYEVNWQGDF